MLYHKIKEFIRGYLGHLLPILLPSETVDRVTFYTLDSLDALPITFFIAITP